MAEIKVNPENYDAIREAYLRQQEKGLKKIKKEAGEKDVLEFVKDQIRERADKQSSEIPVSDRIGVSSTHVEESSQIKNIREALVHQNLQEEEIKRSLTEHKITQK